MASAILAKLHCNSIAVEPQRRLQRSTPSLDDTQKPNERLHLCITSYPRIRSNQQAFAQSRCRAIAASMDPSHAVPYIAPMRLDVDSGVHVDPSAAHANPSPLHVYPWPFSPRLRR